MTTTRLSRSAALVACAATILVAGCSSSTTPTTASTATTAAAGEPTETTSAPASSTASSLTASEIVAQLAASGLPVTGSTDVTAESDPNKLLGRPGGYTSKTTFSDSTIDTSTVLDSDPGSVELGGAVEVFADAAAAQTRADYITTVTKGSPALTEYDVVAGPILLRLSRSLTPDQVSTYKTALGA